MEAKRLTREQIQKAEAVLAQGNRVELIPVKGGVKLLPVDGGSQVEQAASAGHLAFVALAEAGTLDPVTAGEH